MPLDFTGSDIDAFYDDDYCQDREEALAAFEHSPEYEALVQRGLVPSHVRPLLEFAYELWFEPDDIEADILLELLHDLPRLRPCCKKQIRAIIDELQAFWAFAGRELHYPHARACMAMLGRDGARALECAIETAREQQKRRTRHARQLSFAAIRRGPVLFDDRSRVRADPQS